MKRSIIGATATLLVSLALAVPGHPAAAVGATYPFSALPAGQHVAFDPDTDVLRFDSTAIAASGVILADSYNGYLVVAAGGKQVYVDGLTLDKVSTTNVVFADGSVARVGDGTTSTAGDTAGQTWDLTASTKANQLMGLGGPDHLTGGSGPDRLLGTPQWAVAPGVATLAGGPGDDTYAIDPSKGDVIVEQPGSGTDTVEASGTATLATNVENLTLVGAEQADGTGNAGPNVLIGNDGNNHLYGLGGNDTLIQRSADTLEGGSGDDTYVTTSQSFSVIEAAGGGTDLIKGAVVGTLPAGVENGTLTGSAADNLGGNTANNILTGNSAANGINGAEGIDTLAGGGGPDSFWAPATDGVDVVTDFTTKSDRVLVDYAWKIGDYVAHPSIDRKTNRTGPGGFSLSNELVIITRNVSSITMANAASVIGSATSAYKKGDRRLFVVDNGTTSQLLRFASSGNDAKVSASELRPIFTIRNRTGLSVNDFTLG
jgi:prepilin-type processing-associated H-X9-DG protein